MPMPPKRLYATKVSAAMNQLGIKGFSLTMVISFSKAVSNLPHAAMAKISVAMTRMGIREEKALTMPLTPKMATIATMTVNTALPIHAGTSKSCCSIAPTPADISTTTPKRNSAVMTPAALRSHATFSQGTRR